MYHHLWLPSVVGLSILANIMDSEHRPGKMLLSIE
jgi:hypothetical protein